MDLKQEALQWMAENNKWGTEGDLYKGFAQKLDAAIRKQDDVITTWVMGSGTTKSGHAYTLRWERGHFSAIRLSPEESEARNAPPMSFTTFEKKLEADQEEPAGHEEPEAPPKSKFEAYMDQAWAALSPDNQYAGSMPTRRSEIKTFKRYLEKARACADKRKQTKQYLKQCKKQLRRWNRRHFIGSYKLLIISIIATSWFIYQMYQRYLETGSFFEMEGAASEPFYAYVIGFLFVFGVVGYFWSQRAPAWLIVSKEMTKGHQILEDWENDSKTTFYSTEKYYRHSDGRIERADNTGEMGSQFIVAAIFWILKMIALYLLIPFISIYGFLRYYVFYK